ncbi:alcohol dehydrogenase catalytic domain-containing protein [Nocardia sp. NPDC049190]|uniref:alcohol dehydrogenase catalytic domain-containing protein n=1 Tax=Nocardia sp. NPDC049190 TaxID=3155650 RepID=UPI00340366F2
MKALTDAGLRQISYSTRAAPTLPGPDGATIRATAAGIRGDDLHIYAGQAFAPCWSHTGHEAVGVLDPAR